MSDLKYWAFTLILLAGLAWLMVLAVRAAKRDRRLAGVMFAVNMIFGGKTTQPPPRHEFEEEAEKGQKQGGSPKAGQG
jgi:hypothetical protein